MKSRLHILSAPTSIFLAISGRCNMNCKHCNVGDHQNKNIPELTTEQWKKFFDELEELKVFRIRISGGEPFVRKDIYELMDYMQEKHFWIDINTNATLIDEEGARRIGRYPKVGNIMVSLDGSNEKVYEMLRGKGTWKKAVKGIENLIRYNGRRVSFYCTVTKYNVDDIENMIELVKSWGQTGGIKFNFIIPGGNADIFFKYISLNDKERRDLINRTPELKEKYGNLISGTIFDSYYMFKRIEENYKKFKDKMKEPAYITGCGTVRNEVTVRFEGNVTPCDRLSHMVCGNILEQSLKDIWLHSPVLNEFRKRLDMTLDDFEECRDCEYKYFCTGGCPAVSMSFRNTIFGYDPLSCYKVYTLEKEFLPENEFNERKQQQEIKS